MTINEQNRTIESECPSCNYVGKFQYIGEQDMFNGRFISLYNCLGCHSTLTENSLREKR